MRKLTEGKFLSSSYCDPCKNFQVFLTGVGSLYTFRHTRLFSVRKTSAGLSPSELGASRSPASSTGTGV